MLEHLGLLSEFAAKNFGDKEALYFDERSFSFQELHELVEKFAAALISLGVKEKEVVTLYASNSWEWIVSYFAIARIGAVINPVNTMLTSVEIIYVVNDCGAKTIISSEDKIHALSNIREHTQIENIISFGKKGDGIHSFPSLLAENFLIERKPNISPKDLSTIAYTSGTTGHPKGAMQSHEAVILNGSMMSQLHMRGSDDTVVSALPCPHVYANVLMTGMMMFGTKLVLHKTFEVNAIFESIKIHEATIFDGVPTMYMFMLNSPDLKSSKLSSLKRCYVGGQTMPVATMTEVEKEFKVPLIELWGMTEIAGLGATFPLYGPNKHGSIGCAIPLLSAKNCRCK